MTGLSREMTRAHTLNIIMKLFAHLYVQQMSRNTIIHIQQRKGAPT